MRWTLANGCTLDDDPARIDRDRLYAWLSSDAYWWSGGLARQVLDAALDESVNLSLLDSGGQFVGFGRLVTDRATFAYWCDVYIERQHRGRGLGQQLTRHALAHPAVATCRRIMLATRDAHSVYERAGFSPLAQPETFMEVVRPNAGAGRDESDSLARPSTKPIRRNPWRWLRVCDAALRLLTCDDAVAAGRRSQPGLSRAS